MKQINNGGKKLMNKSMRSCKQNSSKCGSKLHNHMECQFGVVDSIASIG